MGTISQLGPFPLVDPIDLLNPVPVLVIGSVDVNVVGQVGAAPYSHWATGSANQDSTVIKAAAGRVYGIYGMSAIANARYLKVYDKATGPTAADTPVLRFLIPANGSVNFPVPVGALFAAGVSFRITTGIADNDTGACSANDCVVEFLYA